MAAGQVFVMTLGEIDLSIGALYLITPFVFWKINAAGVPLVPSVILALLVAMLIGAINGFFVAWVGIASFVATLAMLFFLDGITLIVSHSEEITTPGHIDHRRHHVRAGPRRRHVLGADLGDRDRDRPAGAPVLHPLGPLHRRGRRKPPGRRGGGHQHQVGDAPQLHALLPLLRVRRPPRGDSYLQHDPGPVGLELGDLLLAVAAVIIGGTLMTGGAGTVVGALIGALFLGILTDGLVIKGVSANYEDMYLGMAIIIAMTVNVYVQRVRRGSGRG